MSFDDPDERLRFQKAAVSILESMETPLVILDEVQKMPALFDPLKFIVDRQKKQRSDSPRRFVLTGSSQFLLLKGIRETFAGRVALCTLYPFSLSEINSGSNPSLLSGIWREGKIAAEWPQRFYSLPADKVRHMISIRDSHQTWGGYPPVWQRPDETAKINWLRDYRKTYLERDISDVGQSELSLPPLFYLEAGTK